MVSKGARQNQGLFPSERKTVPHTSLHNTIQDVFTRRHHKTIDGVIKEGVLENVDAIRICPIAIRSEVDFANQIARIANLSMTLGYTLEEEGRLLTKEEAYGQIGHSVSLLNAILG